MTDLDAIREVEQAVKVAEMLRFDNVTVKLEAVRMVLERAVRPHD